MIKALIWSQTATEGRSWDSASVSLAERLANISHNSARLSACSWWSSLRAPCDCNISVSWLTTEARRDHCCLSSLADGKPRSTASLLFFFLYFKRLLPLTQGLRLPLMEKHPLKKDPEEVKLFLTHFSTFPWLRKSGRNPGSDKVIASCRDQEVYIEYYGWGGWWSPGSCRTDAGRAPEKPPTPDSWPQSPLHCPLGWPLTWSCFICF